MFLQDFLQEIAEELLAGGGKGNIAAAGNLNYLDLQFYLQLLTCNLQHSCTCHNASETTQFKFYFKIEELYRSSGLEFKDLIRHVWDITLLSEL